jgi:hypothetical protein
MTDVALPLLSTDQMASFAARGFLRLEAVVPDDVNAQALQELPSLFRSWLDEFRGADAASRAEDEARGRPALPRSGTVLADAYPADSAFGRMVRVPAVAGAIASLVGPDPVVDHHFVHLKAAGDLNAQGLHCDAIIDDGIAFDVQLFWFPHDVLPKAGGTRYIPGSHLRRVNMDDVARYQHLVGEEHVVCPAGTVVIFHQGLWHAGAPNHSHTLRVMGKLRLNPTRPQVRLWDTSDLDARNGHDDHVWAATDPTSVASVLRSSEPWMEPSTHRLETVQRARLWRYLSGDDSFDVDWYLTRTERRGALVGEVGR